ncbi:MAG: branched-chain amino acid ABC transporter permease [Clostridiaceae bacterium]|jgi:branched-chain amino acid transport system permease protein|nr:branched-chain amino acid ABC transporter permease [Clostridiaceae bacterium]
MEYLLNQLVNGISQGAIYALMAIGYSVVVGVTGLITFTHGEVIMIGAFASFYIFQFFGNNLILGIAASFIASWLIGMFIYYVCYDRFFEAPSHISLICTIGASMLIKNLAQIYFGPNQKPMLNIIDNKVFRIGVLQISLIQIVILVTVIVLAGILAFFINNTRWGIMLRTVSQDKKAAYLMGVNVRRTAMIGNCIGCGLAGIAGMLISIYYQTLQATMGGPLGMKAFSSSVLGGLTDTRFSALGGLAIGLIENLGITISTASFRDIFAFGFLIAVLIIRPEGFASKKGARP